MDSIVLCTVCHIIAISILSLLLPFFQSLFPRTDHNIYRVHHIDQPSQRTDTGMSTVPDSQVLLNDEAKSLASQISLTRSDSQRQQDISRQIANRRLESQRSEPSQIAEEYVIPVRLTAIQKSVYRTILLDHAICLETFVESAHKSVESIQQMRDMLDRLNLATLHPLLLAEPMTESQMSESDETWYVVQASSKFEMFVELVEALRYQSVRLLVLAKEPRLERLLRLVCRGLQVHYSQIGIDAGDQSTQDNSVGELDIVFHQDGTDVQFEVPIDLCLAFDNYGTYTKAPLLRMIAINSAEHVARQNLELVTTVSMVAASHETVGVCSNDPSDVAQQIVRFLCGFPFAPEQLQDITFPSSQYDEYSCSSIANGDPIRPVESEPEIIITEIDGLEVHTEAPPPPPPISGDSQVYRVSLTTDSQSQQYISPVHLEHTPTLIYEHRSEIFPKNSDSERIATLEADIDRMMLRFDELRETCRSLHVEKEDLQTSLSTLQKRFDRVLEESRTHRADKMDLKRELDVLKMPALPEESDPTFTSTENTRLRTELEKLKSSMTSKVQDFEFVRQQYQQSSTAAADLANENVSLKNALTVSETKSGTGYALLLAQFAQHRTDKAAELTALEMRNNVLIEQLKRVREDKRGREGRRETDRKRASSAQEVGTRKKEKLGVSPLQRLSVASLIQ